jgi:hypothetical protein
MEKNLNETGGNPNVIGKNPIVTAENGNVILENVIVMVRSGDGACPIPTTDHRIPAIRRNPLPGYSYTPDSCRHRRNLPF